MDDRGLYSNLRIPHAANVDDMQPLSWVAVAQDGETSVLFSCSNGHLSSLHRYTITPHGTVGPRVCCPEPGCNFAEWIVLHGWESCDAAPQPSPECEPPDGDAGADE